MMLNIISDTPKFKTDSYRSDIDGLRAIAVIIVILFHFNTTGLFSGGFIGVDIFFVISGYLITGLIYNRLLKNNFSYIDFISSRIGRLYPALIVIILISLFIGFFIYSNAYLKSEAKASFFSTLSISNIYFSTAGSYWDLESNTNPLLHTWSLSVEQQFYLFFPLLMMVIFYILKSKIKITIPILFLASLSYTVLSEKNSTELFYLTQFRMFEFLAGSIVFFYEDKINKASKLLKEIFVISSLSTIIFCTLYYQPSMTGHPGIKTIPILMSAAICIAYGNTSSIGKILKITPLVFIGIISYSVYLIHWPIIVFFKYITKIDTIGVAWQSILSIFILFFGTLLYKYIENRYRLLKPFDGVKPFIMMAVPTLVILIVSINIYNIKIKVSPIVKKFDSWTEFCNDNTQIGSPPKYSWSCGFGDANATRKILLIGDSTSAQLIPFYDRLGKKYGISFYIIASPHCIPIDGFNYEKSSQASRCKETINYGKNIINQSSEIIIAGIWQDGHTHNKEFRELLLNFIRKNNNKKFIIMSSTPKFESDPLFYNESIIMSHFSGTPKKSDINTDNLIFSLLKNERNVSLMDLRDNDFFKKIPFLNKKPMYFDASHLTSDGSIQYSIDAENDVMKTLR